MKKLLLTITLLFLSLTAYAGYGRNGNSGYNSRHGYNVPFIVLPNDSTVLYIGPTRTYKTINAGVAAIVASGLTTIHVDPGVYYVNPDRVQIPAGITMEGAGESSTIIVDTTPAGGAGICLELMGDNFLKTMRVEGRNNAQALSGTAILFTGSSNECDNVTTYGQFDNINVAYGSDFNIMLYCTWDGFAYDGGNISGNISIFNATVNATPTVNDSCAFLLVQGTVTVQDSIINLQRGDTDNVLSFLKAFDNDPHTPRIQSINNTVTIRNTTSGHTAIVDGFNSYDSQYAHLSCNSNRDTLYLYSNTSFYHWRSVNGHIDYHVGTGNLNPTYFSGGTWTAY